MERFDIYNADGVRTGRTADRGTKCADGEFYLGVHIYICDSKGRFLLQKRAAGKSFLADSWEIHMGHVMAGEGSLEAARREIAEELGADIPPESFSHVTQFVWSEINHLIDIFFVKADLDISSLTLQESEVSDVKWISADEMKAFVPEMYYRPERYREIVLEFINLGCKKADE